ncbi:MAG: WG repeat-containing protein [Hungatella sp.]|nr:WG repeat-containing protein [Hungatella sp.]
MFIPCRYEEAYSFSNRLAPVKYAGEWGYINRYGTWIIEPQFSTAYPFLREEVL